MEEQSLVNLSPRELLDRGYNPAGVEVLRQVASGELDPSELMERLDSERNKSYERRLFEFRQYLDSRKELNRSQRRGYVKEFKKKERRA